MNAITEVADTRAAETPERRFERLLHTIVEGTASHIGEDFFRSLVQKLAQALGVRYAFVAEFEGRRDRVRTLAFWSSDGLMDNIEYEIEGTPCERVLAGEPQLYCDNVADLFPKEKEELDSLGVVSYLAIPLFDLNGDVLGHLAAMDDRPMVDRRTDMSIFRIFGIRVAAELQRRNAERALQVSEARLSTILASTVDSIITIDDQRRIVLFNKAAEKTFGCVAEWAIGQPFERFLSRPFRAVLEDFLDEIGEVGSAPAKLWAPSGLTALRASGEEFPVSVTVSPAKAGNQLLFTFILHDVNEREDADRQMQRLLREREYLEQEITKGYNLDRIVSSSPVMKRLFDDVERIAPLDSTVLVLGETGVGKELVARAVHNLSGRRDKPLIKLNCAALPAELVESELFGHEKGAFTGATAKRMGRFELADGGTLFLDEVGELSLAAQAKLLRVLQDQEFERVGGSTSIRVDTRVIAATNRDLGEMVEQGTFRADLYYRLCVFPLKIPPLRERREDIPRLARQFLQHFARKFGKDLKDLSAATIGRLQAYRWDGNVRELQNVIERAAILGAGPILEIGEELTPVEGKQLAGQPTSLAEVERRHIESVLEQTGWVVEGAHGAAKILEINPSTLRTRMQKLGIRKPASLSR